MRAKISLTLITLLLLFASSFFEFADAKVKKNHARATAGEDLAPPPPPSNSDKKGKTVAKTKAKAPSIPEPSRPGEEFSIEDVDEDKIDEILKDAVKNLVVFFYDGRVNCPNCGEALSEVEEIDDDIEATGYIEVVKTDDRRVAREFGVNTFPSLVYFRRRNPILYDGEFKDSEIVWRWIRAHDEVATWDLTDENFESRTDSFSPDEGTLDWFVMFYDSEEPDCNAFVATWETVAHKLRGLVNVGKVDTSVSDDVTERFRIDDGQCPTFLLFHRGKMYRYNDPAKDPKGLTQFALSKFKDQRGHRVPEPPTALENLYEHIKEQILDALDDNQTLTVIGVGGLIGIVSLTLLFKAYKIRQQQNIDKKSI
jgi:thioredoxin-like negative regulator of GroEL